MAVAKGAKVSAVVSKKMIVVCWIAYYMPEFEVDLPQVSMASW